VSKVRIPPPKKNLIPKSKLCKLRGELEEIREQANLISRDLCDIVTVLNVRSVHHTDLQQAHGLLVRGLSNIDESIQLLTKFQ
jgi:hypothetical protein